MKQVAVIEFPGSHGAALLVEAIARLGNCDVRLVWHADDSFGKAELLLVPGGAAFGDIVRPGALAKSSPAAAGIRKFDQEGGKIIGIGNGMQVLCEIGVLPGVLIANKLGTTINQNVMLKIESNNATFLKEIDEKRVFVLPIACSYGTYYADKRTLKDMDENGQIAFRYCDQFGEYDPADPFNGCVECIAGITNAKKNALGIMAHPERAESERVGSGDGLDLLKILCAA